VIPFSLKFRTCEKSRLGLGDTVWRTKATGVLSHAEGPFSDLDSGQIGEALGDLRVARCN
jgi:hypothetical protein